MFVLRRRSRRRGDCAQRQCSFLLNWIRELTFPLCSTTLNILHLLLHSSAPFDLYKTASDLNFISTHRLASLVLGQPLTHSLPSSPSSPPNKVRKGGKGREGQMAVPQEQMRSKGQRWQCSEAALRNEQYCCWPRSSTSAYAEMCTRIVRPIRKQ